MIPIHALLNDGGMVETCANIDDVVLLSSFEETISVVQEMGVSNSARNAVYEPAELIAHFLGLNCTPVTSRTAISAVVAHAPLPMTIIVRRMEEAYAAHLADYAACDCPAPYSFHFMTALRNTSYNWLGFMWQPGFGQNFYQIKEYMYSSGISATL